MAAQQDPSSTSSVVNTGGVASSISDASKRPRRNKAKRPRDVC